MPVKNSAIGTFIRDSGYESFESRLADWTAEQIARCPGYCYSTRVVYLEVRRGTYYKGPYLAEGVVYARFYLEMQYV